jgi:excinuclease UvrABC nuclease subunit
MVRGALVGIPGLGKSRQARLIKELGGVRAAQRASLEDLRALTWLPQTVAEATYAHLHPKRATVSA